MIHGISKIHWQLVENFCKLWIILSVLNTAISENIYTMGNFSEFAKDAVEQNYNLCIAYLDNGYLFFPVNPLILTNKWDNFKNLNILKAKLFVNFHSRE